MKGSVKGVYLINARRYHRKTTTTATCRSERTVATEVVPTHIDLTIHYDQIVRMLGERAARSKSGKATAMHGAVVVKRRGVRVEDVEVADDGATS